MFFDNFKVLIEDLRITHVKRIDNNRNIVILATDIIVIVLILIQSELSKEKVVKLNYVVRS